MQSCQMEVASKSKNQSAWIVRLLPIIIYSQQNGSILQKNVCWNLNDVGPVFDGDGTLAQLMQLILPSARISISLPFHIGISSLVCLVAL